MNAKKKTPWYIRASFWNLVVQSFQIAIGAFQGISMANEEMVSNYNIWLAFGQGALGIISLWTRDSNRNDVIDIAEEQTIPDLTITSDKPVNIIDETPKE